MNLKIENPLEKVIFALIFGAAYGLFIGLSPLGAVYRSEYCYDMGGDEFLFGGKQVVMSICAALAFYILTFPVSGRWKGILKTIRLSYLCLYLYSIFHVCRDVRHNPCLRLDNFADITGEFLFRFLFVSLVLTAFSTIVLVPVLVICKFIPARLFAEKNDFLKLDLDAK